MLIFLKDTSQRGSGIRRFGSTTAAFISDYNDTSRCINRGGGHVRHWCLQERHTLCNVSSVYRNKHTSCNVFNRNRG